MKKKYGGYWILIWVASIFFMGPSTVLANNTVVVIPLGGAKSYMYWQGIWTVDADYKIGDGVQHEGSSYVCVEAHRSEAPPSVYWSLLALKGTDGASGTDGVDGAPGAPGADGADGAPGTDGTDGAPGTDGTDGLNCWDLDDSGTCDIETEDTNTDGTCDANDCSGPEGPVGPISPRTCYTVTIDNRTGANWKHGRFSIPFSCYPPFMSTGYPTAVPSDFGCDVELWVEHHQANNAGYWRGHRNAQISWWPNGEGSGHYYAQVGDFSDCTIHDIQTSPGEILLGSHSSDMCRLSDSYSDGTSWIQSSPGDNGGLNNLGISATAFTRCTIRVCKNEESGTYEMAERTGGEP